MKVIKKIAWILFILLIGLIIAALVVPTVFKDEIVEKLKITLNDQLNAEVDFDDINISILSSFPNARVDIENLTITGIDKYADTELYNSKHTMLDVSLPSLIKEDIPYQLREVTLDNAHITIVRSKDGTANYSITKESEGEAASYTLDLQKYSLNDSKITYIDQSAKLKMTIDDLNHNGTGRFTENIYDLDTYSQSGNMTVISDGVSYLRNAKAQLDATINVDVSNEKYTLKNNKLTLNELNLEGDGYVKMNGDNMFVDAKLKGLEDNFRSYLSVVPHAYVDQFTNVATEGSGSLTAYIKGNYNSLASVYPALDIDLNISDAYVKYNNMPTAVEKIFAQIQIDAKEGNYNDMIVNIPALKAQVGDDPVDAHLMITESSSDPKVEGGLVADVDLRNWKSALPAEMIIDMNGKVNADIEFGGRVSDIESSNYEALALKGNVSISDLDVKRASSPDLVIKSGTVIATPKKLDIDMNGVRYGKSDLSIKSNVSNPLLLAINTNVPIVAVLDINAGTIDANELLGPTDTNANTANQSTSGIGFNIENSKVELNATVDKIIYSDQTWTKVDLEGKLDGDKIDITNATAMLDDNDVSIKGALNNPLGYMEGTETLTGKIDVKSNKLDMNDFMTETSDTESTVFLIPDNVDVDITASIKDLTYTNMNMVNSKATIEIIDQKANITSLTTNTLGGEIAMQGAYNTKDIASPSFDMMLDFNKIEFVKAFDKMETMQKLAPIAKYISGFFNSTLTFKGNLGQDMMPDLATLDASGFVETFASSIDNFKVLDGLAEKLDIEELKSLALENTKNWFEIVDGTVELKPKKFTVKDIDMAIAGKHGFGKDMNYFLEMKVPRQILKDNVVTGILNQGMTKVEAEAAKYGIKIGTGDYINLEIGITGSMQSPKYSIKPVGYESGDIKDAVQDEINNQIETVKDSVKTVINDTKETIKDTVKTVTNQAVDSVKTVVNDKVTEVKDSVKTVINNQVDSLATQVGLDSLKDKVKDILGTGADKEVDKIKDKIKDWNPWGKKKKKN